MRIISFTPAGNKLNRVLCEKVGAEGFSVKPDDYLKLTDLQSFTAQCFAEGVPMVFIGAAGIAVRAVSKHLKDKFTDPPVIVIDEKGQFVLPLLSGHYGGGNKLALKISQAINAQPVITTATDVQGLFAVDVFARENRLVIKERELAKKVSAVLLQGENIGIYTEQELKGRLPKGLAWTDIGKTADKKNLGIYIGIKNRNPFEQTLHLIPQCLWVGIGCKKGTDSEKIEKAVTETFRENKLFEEGIAGFTSIDIKKEEEGLLAYSAKMNRNIIFCSAEEMVRIEGIFTASSFVKSITGTDNVCDRSAVLAAEQNNLIVRKTSKDGVTVAVAAAEWSVEFE